MKSLLFRLWSYLSIALAVVLLIVSPSSGFLERWSQAWKIASPEMMSLAEAGQAPRDRLTSEPWWQDEVQYRVNITRGQQYNHCLFGDSISSGLGNTLGDRTFNFALGGMSSVSLVAQLNQLVAAGVRCGQVMIAIGTNDADYSITNADFVLNMKEAIALSRQLQAFHILLIPAFYSTVAASQNIEMAGPIARVEEINALLRQIAVETQVTLTDAGLQSLYDGQALRGDLTIDGVHLNAAGRVLYRDALFRLINAPPF